VSRPKDNKPTEAPEAEPKQGFVTMLVGELKAISPVLVLVGPIAAAAYLVYGAINFIEQNELDGPGWAPSAFSNLAWVALLSLVALFVAGLKRDRTGTLTLVGGAGQLLFVASVVVFSLAWSSERQNYWDAYHFAVLFWMGAVGTLLAVAALWIAARRGSSVAGALQGSAVVCLLLLLFVWMWTWNPQIQAFEGWLGRTFFYATHN
jgi:hypothetical protein